MLISSLPAQVTGYLGKRFIAEVQPNIAVHNWASSVFTDTKAQWAVSPGIHLEYTVGRKGAWAIDYHFSRLSQKMYMPISIYDPWASDTSFNVSLTKSPITSHNVGISYRYYFLTPSSWSIAPLGTYFCVGLSKSFGISASVSDNPLNYQLPTIKNRTYLKFGFGSRNIFWHKLTLDYGVSCNISSLKMLLLDEGNYSDYNRTKMYKEQIDEWNTAKMVEGVRMPNFFTANVGIGWLLF